MSRHQEYLSSDETQERPGCAREIARTFKCTGNYLSLSLSHCSSEKLKSYFFRQLFEKLRRDSPGALSKIIPVAGDVTEPELGISADDQDMLIRSVSVVFHSAATVKFDEALKLSVTINILGTKRLVQLCHRMRNVEVREKHIFFFFIWNVEPRFVNLVNLVNLKLINQRHDQSTFYECAFTKDYSIFFLHGGLHLYCIERYDSRSISSRESFEYFVSCLLMAYDVDF